MLRRVHYEPPGSDGHAGLDDGRPVEYPVMARVAATHHLGRAPALYKRDASAPTLARRTVATRGAAALAEAPRAAKRDARNRMPFGRARTHNGLVLLDSQRFISNSTMTLDWPTFKDILDHVMNMNGVVARKQAYLRAHAIATHPVATDFSSRFNMLVAKRDPQEFRRFVKEFVSYLGGAVVDEGGLAGFVPFYTSGRQSFDHLVEEVFMAAKSDSGWVRFGGEFAALTEVGYSALMHFNQPDQFLPYVERTIREMGAHVTDMSALGSFMPFYNGVCARQNFTVLRQELKEAITQPSECGGGWLQYDNVKAET